jgi:hypothetical protein
MPRPGRESARGRTAHELVLITWRDIPAQITGRSGEVKHQVMLPHRFQKAIDRAAMVADKKTAQEYVGEWQRATVPVATDHDIAVAAEAYAHDIERDYPNDRLHQLVNNGGWDPSRPSPPTPQEIES